MDMDIVYIVFDFCRFLFPWILGIVGLGMLLEKITYWIYQ
jgi:hypothetical protein